LLSAVLQPFYQHPATLTQPVTGWQAQLILTIPFYDGGLRYGLGHEREHLFSESLVALEGGLRQARSEVRAGFEGVQRADESLKSARDAARFADQALELANIAYRAGASTNIEVVDAERRARDAETAAVIAEDNARQARLELLAASGHFP
jgi:outer membrane protein TolC